MYSKTVSSSEYVANNKHKNKLLDELIKDIKHNKENSFNQLYELTKKDVYFYALSIIKNDADAQYVVQSVYLNFYRTIDGYKFMNKPLAFLLTITRNECMMKYRKYSKETELSEFVLQSYEKKYI